MTDVMNEIKKRLDAKVELRALIEDGGRGTLRHRLLDDMIYDSEAERHIQYLLARVEALEAQNERLKIGLETIRNDAREHLSGNCPGMALFIAGLASTALNESEVRK